MKNFKFSLFFSSLFFAALVWVAVNLENEFHATIEIPVRVENLPPQKAIAAEIPTLIKINVRGTGWNIVRAMLSPNLRYEINFRQLAARDTFFTIKQLNDRIELSRELYVTQTFPETMRVRIDDKISKQVPLVANAEISYRNGFGIVGKIKTVPEKITIYGARSLLNRMNEWHTEKILLNDIFTPTKIEANVFDTLNLQITKSLATASIEFDVQSIAEKAIDNIPVELTQVPEKRTVVLIPNTISIIIRSGVNTIAPITQKNFSAYVDYKTILLDTSGFVSPTIVAPENIKIVQQQPEKLQYVIRR